MKISELIKNVKYTSITGSTEKEIASLCHDSRKAEKDCAFVCITGVKSDGHEYVKEVINKGAVLIVAEKELEVPQGVTLVITENTRTALADMSAAWFNYPAESLKTIGITGTKGKTTTSYMIYSVLNAAGIKTGLIGTIETIIGEEKIPSSHTTPESYTLQEYFRKMADAGIECVVMEVSSQGLMLDRVAGFEFDYGIFTNIEPDHIGPGEHKDFEDYLNCKRKLFTRCKTGILNADDEHCEEILKGHTCSVETFGMSENADLRACDIVLSSEPGNLFVDYKLSGLLDFEVRVGIPGSFTVYNSLTAIAVCRHFNIPEDIIKRAISSVKVKGRVELVNVSERFTLMIDYAHNAMSLKSLLGTLRDYRPKRLVCCFGCGGNRSRDRRFEMGEISSKMADFTVVTSDNPRFEEPQAIIDDIITGVKKADGEYISIIDRKEAIRYCILNAKDGDVIVLAGKGHEDYQEICGVKHHMDERELIAQVIEETSLEERKEKKLHMPEAVNN